MRALQRQVRRLQRQVERVQKERELRAQYRQLLQQLEHLEHPPLLEPQPPAPAPVPIPRALGLPPPLTPEEITALQEEPMPDPMEEIEHRLGLSITPPSQQTWAG
jgi:hypothetical protein